MRDRWRCRLFGHRTNWTFTRDGSVLRCVRCASAVEQGPVLRPEITHAREVEAQRQAACDAHVVAERERRAAATTSPAWTQLRAIK